MAQSGTGVAPDITTRTRRLGGRRRYLLALVVGLLAAIGWVFVGITVPPLRQTCDPALTAGACSETIVAALKKGMPSLHPLLLSAHAEPGPQSRNDQLGHRATVTFEALGVPGRITVKLYVDMGAHWGGTLDRSDTEVGLWLVAQGAVVAAAIAGIGSWLIRRRGQQA